MRAPKNGCGECRECCIHLIIAPERGMPDGKPGGVPCHLLNERGCSVHGKPEQADLCRTYRCLYRTETFINERPAYRPDKLGVIMQFGSAGLAFFETRPGAFEENRERLRYIRHRMRMPSWTIVNWHYYGSMVGSTHEDVGAENLPSHVEEFFTLDGDHVLRVKPGHAPARVPLPVLRAA